MTEGMFQERGLYYREGGNPTGLPLVFIHGLSGSSSAWKEFESAFATQYRVISFDLRGHGYSQRPRSFAQFAPKHFADDVQALLMHLNVTHPIFVAHSFGTQVLFEFLHQYPGVARGVVFLSPEWQVSRRFLPRVANTLLQPLRLLEHLPLKSPVGGHVEYDPEYRGTGDWNIRRMIKDVSTTGVRSFLFSTMQAFSIQRGNVVDTLDVPVLLIHGKRDTIFPVSNSEELVTRFKNAQAVFLRDADHILVLNHADTVIPTIAQWLEREHAK